MRASIIRVPQRGQIGRSLPNSVGVISACCMVLLRLQAGALQRLSVSRRLGRAAAGDGLTVAHAALRVWSKLTTVSGNAQIQGLGKIAREAPARGFALAAPGLRALRSGGGDSTPRATALSSARPSR
jgi:hypothetical protein